MFSSVQPVCLLVGPSNPFSCNYHYVWSYLAFYTVHYLWSYLAFYAVHDVLMASILGGLSFPPPCWSWSYSILVIWRTQTTHWKSPWYWERSRAEEEGVRGWDGRMASPMQLTWTWANSGRWWGTGKPVMLQPMGHKESDMTGQLNNNNNRRVGHN